MTRQDADDARPAGADSDGDDPKGRQMLIVEPSRVLRDACAEHCRARGLSSVFAHDVVSALGVVCADKPILILTALELPRLPGTSLVAAIKTSATHRAIPIAILTSTDGADRLGRPGPDAVLRKDRGLLDALDVFLDKVGVARPDQEGGEPSDEAVRLEGRILLADDSPLNSAVLGRVLHVSGADVTCVENGAEALLAVQQQPFDLVLMDIEMPMMDGRQATHVLRARGVRSPIVALTAHDPEAFHASDTAREFDGILHKPIRPAALVRACHDYLTRGARVG